MSSILKQIKLKYNALLDTGINDALNLVESKRVYLLNLFWVHWLLIQITLILEDFLTKENPTPEILAHSITFVGVLVIGVLQKHKKFISARILFFVLLLYSNILFANVLEPGKQIEYFYLIIPPFLLLFTNNSKILYGMFILCYLLFVVPNQFLHIYPEGTGSSKVLALILFVIIFLQVNFFKKTNISSERAIEKKRQELEELNKHQSQFFINVSHEIRTPLTLLLGEADKLSEINKENVSNVFKLENNIKKQINKIKKIVDDVIDLAKMKTSTFNLHTKNGNLKELVQKIYVSFEPLFKQKEINYSLHIISPINNYVLLDELFFERALNNIIVNALKYTPKNGSVSILIKQEFKEIILEITDTGIGISEKEINKIFDRFYQVSNHINKSGGSGVGLAFSSEIIKKHNGKIFVNSKEGFGSTFVIKLPTQEEKIITTTNKKKVEKVKENVLKPFLKTTSDKTILIVDDSYEMRDYLKELLEKKYSCLEAENGEEALEIIKKAKIDFLLTDYMMPAMNGFELIKKIKESNYNFPILMLTARTDNQSKIDVLRLGIDDYLFKPFQKEELLIRIKNALTNYINREFYIQKEGMELKNHQEKNEWLRELNLYITENCGQRKLLQSDIAIFMNMSLSTFYRKIKSETGLTPNLFITEVKLLKSRKIIEEKSAKTLKEVTIEAGFTNTSYFSNLYLERFGTRPII